MVWECKSGQRGDVNPRCHISGRGGKGGVGAWKTSWGGHNISQLRPRPCDHTGSLEAAHVDGKVELMSLCVCVCVVYMCVCVCVQA